MTVVAFYLYEPSNREAIEFFVFYFTDGKDGELFLF